MAISFKHSGDFSKTSNFLKRTRTLSNRANLDEYGKLGVQALSLATPKDSGVTADSWYYEIERNGDSFSINWLNSNVNNGVVVAVLIQYGHGTGTGGYVKGTDYINPAMRKVFDKIANDIWEEVRKE